jgi:hypothetical protein
LEDLLTFVEIAPTMCDMSVADVEQARHKVAHEVEIARKAAAALPMLERKLHAYDQVLADLRAMKSNGHEPEPEVTAGPPPLDYTSMTRGEAVRAVLERLPGVSPEKVVEVLTGAGRTVDNTHKISNELNRLKKRGLVENRGRGRWYLVE